MDDWLKNTQTFLVESYGLETAFAGRVALLIAYLYQYNLGPRITSGFRDPAKQKAMRERWDRGDRSGLRERPAVDSLHMATGWGGKPASKAIDIVSTDERTAANIAKALGIGAGLDFKKSDPGHYYDKGAR